MEMNRPQQEEPTLFSKAEAALCQATKKLILEAQKTGRPLIVWENGKVAEVPSTRFRVDDDSKEEYLNSNKG